MTVIDGRDPNVYCQCTAHWFRHLRQGYCPPVGSPESMAYAAKTDSVSMTWDSTHGEDVMRGEWKKCAVCGMPTNLGRVCTDLRCEIAR